MPVLRWINTVLSNLKTRLSGIFKALGFDYFTERDSGVSSYLFNRRSRLSSMTERVLHVTCLGEACQEYLLKRT